MLDRVPLIWSRDLVLLLRLASLLGGRRLSAGDDAVSASVAASAVRVLSFSAVVSTVGLGAAPTLVDFAFAVGLWALGLMITAAG